MKNKLFLLLVDKNPAAATRLKDSNDDYYSISSTLPITEKIVIKEEKYIYTLQSHTMIVQSEILTFISRSAYYSYLAIFTDNYQNTYQLSIRFDAEDKIIPDLEFVIIENNTTIDVTDIPDSLIARLIQLAKNQCQPIIGSARQQLSAHNTHLFDLLEKNEEYVIKELASNNTGMVTQKCADAIDDISDTLEDISIFCHEPSLRDYMAMVNGLAQTIEIEDSDDELSSRPSSHSATRAIVDPVLITANQLAQTLRALLISKNLSSATTELIDAFTALEERLKIIACMGSDKSCYFSAQDMITINALFYLHLQSGRQILGRLLLSRKKTDLNQAYKLAHFTSFDTDKLVRVALQTVNADMLNFVIIHGQFAIDTFQMADGVNAAMYLTRLTKTEKIPGAAKCLEILMRHGASLMILGPSQLPIAFELLISPHPALCETFANSFESETALQLFLETLLKHFVDRSSACAEMDRVKLYIQILKQMQNQDIPPSADLDFIDYVRKCKYQLFKLALNLPCRERKKAFSQLNSLKTDAYLAANTDSARKHHKHELDKNLFTLKGEINRILNREKLQSRLTIFKHSQDPRDMIDKLREHIRANIQR